jgi:hypothetical protein
MRSRCFPLEVGGVALNVLHQGFGYFLQRINNRHRADRDASRTVDALGTLWFH